MYDLNLLKTVADCRTVMERARKQGHEDVYAAVFRRMCELSGPTDDVEDDALVRDFHATLAAYEQLLTEKNGRNTLAGRTRQKIQNKGVLQSLIEWTMARHETDGFRLLVKAGLYELTGEFIVLRHANRFPLEVVDRARGRLQEHGIDVEQDRT